ncbi:MAG: hypothetical protein A2542_01255 [Parcubacteria group bacterium RIFOXYD2_FULL_52_8]|nr:MAG: hypothetical protein A2542_01255 [Parcubacteria group bacterium RIFOXYD2_FULL_52_8]
MTTTLKSLAIIGGALLIAGAMVVLQTNNNSSTASRENVLLEGNRQLVLITAAGGYTPQITEAQANTATTLRVKTIGSLDCALAIAIPRIGYRKNLPLQGETDIELGSYEKGDTLTGTCAMGMYSFQIRFL